MNIYPFEFIPFAITLVCGFIIGFCVALNLIRGKDDA